MTLRVGIIGAGQAGERQALGFSSSARATVVGVADVVEERAAGLAQKFGAQTFTDWRRLVDSGLDILVVALPHNIHVEPTVAAAERGIHVMMEKPIATTLEDGRRIIDVCAEHDVKLTISFVHRFRQEVQLVYGWVGEGLLGAPMIARETMNGQRGAHLPGWVSSREAAGGGVMMYSAIHGVDRLRWLLHSEVIAVTAQVKRNTDVAEVEHGAVALLTFANGAVATLTASAPEYRAQPGLWETEIFGTSGMARLRTRQWAELSTDDLQVREETQGFSEQLGPHYNFARQAEAFVSAILEDGEPQVTGEDGLRALEVVLAIYRSAEIGESIKID